MEKDILGSGGEIPLDDQGLMDILAAGPGGVEHEVSAEVPPPPQPTAKLDEPSPPSAPVADEGPTEEMKEEMILPTESEKAVLRKKFGLLRVVPVPYTRQDGKIQTYILRQLTRSQWRTMQDAAGKVAESKPGVPVDEIFQEKIVSMACVWPNLPEHEIQASPPGLVPTLYGIVQQMGLFFNPEALMSVTFTL